MATVGFVGFPVCALTRRAAVSHALAAMALLQLRTRNDLIDLRLRLRVRSTSRIRTALGLGLGWNRRGWGFGIGADIRLAFRRIGTHLAIERRSAALSLVMGLPMSDLTFFAAVASQRAFGAFGEVHVLGLNVLAAASCLLMAETLLHVLPYAVVRFR